MIKWQVFIFENENILFYYEILCSSAPKGKEIIQS